jgi:hypothetical protein
MIDLIAGFKLKYKRVNSRLRTQERFDENQARTLRLNSTEKMASFFEQGDVLFEYIKRIII